MMGFWDTPRRGANGFNQAVDRAWWEAARAAKLQWVRLAPDKWPASPGQRDFLLGDADRFEKLVVADLNRLIACLDQAHAAGVPVVLTLLSLPGARWRQHNGNRSDPKLWRDPTFLQAACRCWSELARSLQGHPALVALDPLNEPHPKQIPGSSLGVDAFNTAVAAAIRNVWPGVPVLIESDDYASPAEFARLAPLKDPAVLYSFHLYDPWTFTSAPKEPRKWRYPDRMPPGWSGFDAALASVEAWQKRHAVPASRIVCAEYGCFRTAPGAPRWLADATREIEQRGWHRAFYSFREDTWPGMDYEVGDQALPESYWSAIESGKPVAPPRRQDTPHWKALRL